MFPHEYLLDGDDNYQKYKDCYAVYFGYLVLKNTLTKEEMNIIENNY